MTGGPETAGRDHGPAPDGIAVRRATPDDYVAVLRVIEGALLAVDAGAVRERIVAGEASVAVAGERVVGALVRDGERIVAVAVRRRRRRRGIGRALIERALASTGRLTATFDPRVRGFYEALGFEVRDAPPGGTRGERRDGDDGTRRDDDRLWGVRTG
ncbi:MAG: GNAT family N-acetyltransferase [Haloferacaceae archaeon]